MPEPSPAPGSALTASPASSEELIQSLSSWVFRDQGAAYARNLRTGESLFLQPFMLGLLESARSFGAPSEHVERFLKPFRGTERLRLWRAALRHQLESGGRVRLGGLLQAAGEDVLRSLQGLGILQTRSGFLDDLRSASETSADVPPIRTMGVPTAHRPEMLQRALDSYLPHFKACQREVRVIVADDSRDEPTAARNRQVAEQAAQRHGGSIRYLGPEERRQLIEEHAGGNAERRGALEFLLHDDRGLGQTFGMPRNALLLATQGELVFCADDDTLCRSWVSHRHRRGLELWEGKGSASPITEHPTRDGAAASVVDWQGDLLATHEAFLGRTTGAALLGQGSASDFTVGTLGPKGARRLLGRSDRIALTVSGLVGSSGSDVEAPAALTYLDRTEVQQHLASGGDLLALMESRQVVKLPDWARIASRDDFMTTFFGHDNRRWTVPFFPYLRGEDQLFKEMLTRVDPTAEVAYLPWALEHAPASSGRPRPSQVSLFDMFLAALTEIPRPGPGASVADRARELGNYLVAFAERPLPAFRRAVFEVVAVFTLQEISRHRAFLTENRGRLPESVVAAVAESLQRREALMAEKDLVCAETPWIAKLGSAEKAEEASRSAIRQMGEATAILAKS